MNKLSLIESEDSIIYWFVKEVYINEGSGCETSHKTDKTEKLCETK